MEPVGPRGPRFLRRDVDQFGPAVAPAVRETPRHLRAEVERPGRPLVASELETVPGGNILEIQYHEFEFEEVGDWTWQRVRLDLPSGWRSIAISVSQWDLSWLPKDHHLGLLGVSCTLSLFAGSVLLYAWAVLRDKNTDDPWKAVVTVQVIVLG
jgi:hypothetical protein